MSEIINEYFTCKICKKKYECKDDIPTVCNGCWLKMEIWQRYDSIE